MPYDNFSYQNDRLVIQMTAPNIDGVFPYVINKVVIDYGEGSHKRDKSSSNGKSY